MRLPSHVHRLSSMPFFRRPTLMPSRALSSIAASTSSTSSANVVPNSCADSSADSDPSPTGYYKITLTRSAIGLPTSKKATLVSLGIHRRLQTVFHPHSPEFAGKILAVKELVKVENVTREEVKTKTELRRERKAVKGFEVVGRLGEGPLDAP